MMGGTFDPIHHGHLSSARQTALAFGLERILLVLAARPSHRTARPVAMVEDRLAMLRLATDGDPLFEVSDVEAARPGPSYTYDTLVLLAERFPATKLHLIMGIDAFAEIDSWYRSGEILELASVIVTTRPGHDFPASGPELPIAARDAACYDSTIGCYVHTSGHVLVGHPIDGIDVSASQIRRRVRERLGLDELVGAAVADYILEHEIYGAGPR